MNMSCLCKQCSSISVGFWANWSGYALFAITYVNLYEQSGSSNLIGWKLEICVTSLFSRTRIKLLLKGRVWTFCYLIKSWKNNTIDHSKAVLLLQFFFKIEAFKLLVLLTSDHEVRVWIQLKAQFGSWLYGTYLSSKYELNNVEWDIKHQIIITSLWKIHVCFLAHLSKSSGWAIVITLCLTSSIVRRQQLGC